MNCLEFRRLILADTRRLDEHQQTHAAVCPACAALAAKLAAFDDRIAEAAAVPVPDGLADRVLLRQNLRTQTRRWTWALAASLLLGLGLGWQLHKTAVIGSDAQPVAANLAPASPGAQHPAVAAISYVIDHEPRLLLENRSVDPAVLASALEQLGLKLPQDAAVTYLGKCPVPGGTGEHVVLETRAGKATLILVTGQSFSSRIVVTERGKSAVARPSRTGGYILVTDTLKQTQALEQLLL